MNPESFNEQLILFLRNVVTDKSFQATYRQRSEDFTRTRALPFERVVITLCQFTKLSLQGVLNRFFKALGKATKVVSASALCQARQKLHYGALRALNTAATGYFYRSGKKEGLITTWKGHRILATDGVYITLPDTKETRQHFSIQRNQSGHETVQGLGSCLYDVLNAVPLNFELTPIQAEKQAIFTSHAPYLASTDIHVLDRAYADYAVLAYHVGHQRDFLIRCPTKTSFKRVKEFTTSPDLETEVTLSVTKRAKAFVQAHRLPQTVRVRLIKIFLPTGETEVLLTSLLDRVRYPRDVFGELYQLRWGVETYYDHLKNQLDVQRWNSTKLNGILQELYACLFISSLGNILGRSLDQQLQEGASKRRKPRKYRYKLNRVVLSQSLTALLVDLFLRSDNSLADALDELYMFIKQTPVPIRPGRSFPRKKLTSSEKIRHLKYSKRIWS